VNNHQIKRLLFDTDDVLALLTEAIEAELSDLLGRKWTLDELPERNEWDLLKALPPNLSAYIRSLLDQPGFALELKPDPEAQLAIEYLRRNNDVYIVTAPNLGSETWTYERHLWLKEHFDLDDEHIITTKAKHVCKGDVFVDDNPKYVIKWAQSHPEKQAVLWNTRTNAKVHSIADQWRVYSWDDLITLIESQ
jgi:5'(3')-deoxyribonucleotidase